MLNESVMIIGGMGVGKTSVLYTLTDSLKKQNLFNVVIDEETLYNHNFNLWENGNMSPNACYCSYFYTLKADSEYVLNVEFIDTPCSSLEILKTNTSYIDLIKKCKVIVVTVDAPAIMENDGQYSELKNQVAAYTGFLKDNVDLSEKLIIFVPAKCEKYYFEQSLSDLNAQVYKNYKDLINYLQSKGYPYVMAPVLTHGGKVLASIEDKSGYIIENFIDYDKMPYFDPCFGEICIYYILKYLFNSDSKLQNLFNFNNLKNYNILTNYII